MMNNTMSNKLIISIVLNAINLVKLFFTLIPLYSIPAQLMSALPGSRAIQALFDFFAGLLFIASLFPGLDTLLPEHASPFSSLPSEKALQIASLHPSFIIPFVLFS